MEGIRSFIRHPVDIPVQILQSSCSDSQICISNIGEGGVAFQTQKPFEKGSILEICIPHTQPPFRETGIVCWCQVHGDGFEVGVRFMNEDSRFRARMVQQVCHIEDYRQKARHEGRTLSVEAAAGEWIRLYAANF